MSYGAWHQVWAIGNVSIKIDRAADLLLISEGRSAGEPVGTVLLTFEEARSLTRVLSQMISLFGDTEAAELAATIAEAGG